MAFRISGVSLPDDRNVRIALTSIYGIGWNTAARILDALRIEHSVKVRDLTGTEEQAIRTHIEEKETVEGELRREVSQNIKHHRDIGSYRGTRHAKQLPVRGQRTKTNSRTVRGNVRRTAGSGKKKSAEKT